MSLLLKNIKFRPRKKEEKPFGLDIGESSIRLAKFFKDAQGIELQYLAYKDLPLQLEAMADFSLANLIRSLVKDSGVTSHKVVVNLYGTDPILKFITFPYMSEEELQKTIKWESSKFIVYDLDKMIIDYAVLNETVEDGKKKINVAVAASTKENVLKETNLLREAGLEPVSIEVDTLAQLYISKINEILRDNEVIVLIEFGARRTIINVVDSGVPCFRRECLTLGSKDINKALRDELHVDLAEAERIKQDFSLGLQEPNDTKDKVIYGAISKVVNQVAMEIKRSLDYFIDTFPQKTIARAVIIGGGACLENIDTFLSQRLGMTVEVSDTFKNLRLSNNIKNTDLIQSNSPRFATVLGLALEALE